MDRIYSIDELKTVLHPIFSEYGVRKAILFGSYAKGAATERSDVDLFVDIGLRGLAFFGLLDRVVDTLSLPVDLIDSSQIEPGSPVDMEIKRSGVAIYEQ